MSDDSSANSTPNDDARGNSSDARPLPKEPSLGPACLVVTILSLAVFSSLCAFGSYFVFSDQYPLAAKSIEQQLIPWVESSQLDQQNKAKIVDQLQKLLPQLESRSMDKEHLLRLRNCLQDNPVLLWGGIQSILAQAPGTELSPTELETLQRLTERLLRMAAERGLSRRDLEFTMQELSQVRQDGLSIEVKSDLTADQIRTFMQRAESLLKSNDVPNEPYDKTPAEAFAILIEKALGDE